MPTKDPAAVALGRKGGRARAASQTSRQRSAAAAHAASSYWAGLTDAQKSAVWQARAAVRNTRRKRSSTPIDGLVSDASVTVSRRRPPRRNHTRSA